MRSNFKPISDLLLTHPPAQSWRIPTSLH